MQKKGGKEIKWVYARYIVYTYIQPVTKQMPAQTLSPNLELTI